MKRSFLIIILFLSLFTSCNKIMDTEPLDSYTEDAVWSNYDLAEGYIFNCYANCIGYIYSWEWDAMTKSVKLHPWGGSYVSEKTEQIDRYTDEGWNQFSNIRSVNMILKKVPDAGFTELESNTLLGEGYFLRASIYSYLVFRFGGVQIIKNVLTTDSSFSIPRSSLKETYDFVLSDLDSAVERLPAENERGRANKAAAYALKMRIALQAGAYLNDNSYYEQVKSSGESLFALGQYSLDDYSNLFNEYSTAIASSENILVYERLSTNTYFYGTPMQSLVPNADNLTSKLSDAALAKYPLEESFEGWMYYAPTQDLVDDYLVTDADGQEKEWDKTSYITTGQNVYEKMYKNRDKRFYASIVYDSTQLYNNWVYLRADGNVSSSISPLYGGSINGGGSETGYLFRKYVYEGTKLWYSDPTDFCYSVLRLGEAYLNYAEACIKLGDEATAREYITKTYQKHGGFSNSITSSGDELWNDYKRERHVEMILETGDSYWSLLRWGMQGSGGLKEGYANSAASITELNGYLHGIAITADGKSYSVFEATEKNGL
ncbi:RagB/SusD family nutrient uptake outer membrane protein, partial [Parafilimonas sp.]|uniref:RagB/SusD family nutrient uptake outer membrane protein n=1 Tax=Parafilimonas sp. TaxID=1969739 RepID=UPI0039E4C633